MKKPKEIVDEIDEWVDTKYSVVKKYRENRKNPMKKYHLLVSSESLEGANKPKWVPRPDFGFKSKEGNYVFVEIESHGSLNLNRNVDKYWRLLDFWKNKEKKIAKVHLIHVFHPKRGYETFSAEDIACFIAGKIREEFDFEYYQIRFNSTEEIKDKIDSLLQNDKESNHPISCLKQSS